MIDIAKIEPLKLPSVSLAEKQLLPYFSAVYFVIDCNNQIQYIGQTKSLKARWRDHHKVKAFKAIGNIRIAWIKISDLDLLEPIEQACIEHFNPVLNRHMLRTEVKRERPEDWKHGERKKAVQLMLTKTASDAIDKVARDLGISRSEVLERTARCGGLRF